MDLWAGSVLLQEDINGIDRPVCYFSRKVNKHQQNYSTIARECLAILLALQHFDHFDVYLGIALHPVIVLC